MTIGEIIDLCMGMLYQCICYFYTTVFLSMVVFSTFACIELGKLYGQTNEDDVTIDYVKDRVFNMVAATAFVSALSPFFLIWNLR